MTDSFELKGIYKCLIVALIVLTAGIIIGSAYAGGMTDSDSRELSGYIGTLLDGFENIENSVVKNSLYQWMLLWGLISVSGCFIPGCIFNIGLIGRRSFLTGYTLGCFYKVYSVKGIFMCFSMLPEMILSVPALVVFSSLSLKMSISKHEIKKKLWKKYFLVCVIFLAIFCVVSLFQSYLTTIFMKLFYKLTV